MNDLRTSDSKHDLVVSALCVLDEIKEEMSQGYNHNCINGMVTAPALIQSKV